VQVDLNYLLYRQQVERSRADNAASVAAREAHTQLATLYENAIEQVTNGNLSFLATRDRMRARNWSSELRRLTSVYSGEIELPSKCSA
jgi:hypothetical protein